MSYRTETIVFDEDLLFSPAFQDLTKTAILVFFHFRAKCQMQNNGKSSRAAAWVIQNNGKIVFTYQEAKDFLGLSAQTFVRAIDCLIDHGFIEIARPGGGVSRIPSLYALIDSWQCWGTDNFRVKSRLKDKRRLGRKYNFRSQKVERCLSPKR